ncbi:hypothetical protein Hypma_011422 [Hypsizygus marmoreus]|uniref:Uncharacterized protein n=1 Tax=Hypsizygus marmoreus TaxID=39966 RepID=A0A369JGI7_HYPMA|nr:hypothetical protein Hypma_011422 [Hypsizygus marmoreus]
MATDTSSFLIAESQLILDDARRQKAERIKTVGSPIQLSGKALAMCVQGSYVWIAENTAVARKVDLESGKTLQLYKGHTGPVTTLAFCDKVSGSGDGKILITGSWDQTIKVWDTDTKALLSSTPNAHADFVKSLLVFPSLNLLVSSGSDKIVRFWDLSTPEQKQPLRSLGSISSHTRPVECLDGKALSPTSAILYTADTMGVIKSWTLEKESGPFPRWRGTLQEELSHHRTRINEMIYGNGQLWTASSDETVQVLRQDSSVTRNIKTPPPISHPVAVRSILPLALTEYAEPYLITGAGDMLRVYDVTSPEEPEFVRDVDAHWHDVTAIRLWKRVTLDSEGRTRIEPWIISTSLDSTIRKWPLSELLTPAPPTQTIPPPVLPLPAAKPTEFQMTEDEERELAELLDSD